MSRTAIRGRDKHGTPLVAGDRVIVDVYGDESELPSGTVRSIDRHGDVWVSMDGGREPMAWPRDQVVRDNDESPRHPDPVYAAAIDDGRRGAS